MRSIKIGLCYLMIRSAFLFANCSFAQDNVQASAIDISKPVATAAIQPEGAQDRFLMRAFSEAKYTSLWQDDRQYPAQLSNEKLTLGFVISVDEQGNANGGLTFLLTDYQGPGVYRIEGAEMGQGNFALFQEPGTADLGKLYGSAGSGRGTLTVTGINAGQLEGHFDLALYNKNGDRLNISQGRFKVTLHKMSEK